MWLRSVNLVLSVWRWRYRMEHLLATHSLALLPERWDVTHAKSLFKRRTVHNHTKSTGGDQKLSFLDADSLLPGTLVRFHDGSNMKWQDIDDLDSTEEDSAGEEQSLKVQDAALSDRPLSFESTFPFNHSQSLMPNYLFEYRKYKQNPIVLFQTFGSEGLQLVDHTEIVLSGQAVLQLTFDPGAFGRTRVTTRCQLDHPFYVKNKGGSDSDDNTVPNMVQTHLYFFFRLVVILSQPDRGASWDSMLRHGGWSRVSPARTQRC